MLKKWRTKPQGFASCAGGGGVDIFAFCDDWGVDAVEQLADGDVTLWFESGSPDNWDAASLTYTDGENRVTVSGVGADRITLKFGSEESYQFQNLAMLDVFEENVTKRVFEAGDTGTLASL